MSEKIVLVVGATGQQGGTATSHLLAEGWTVHALTRDTSSAVSRRLADSGAHPVWGDMDDVDSLIAAMSGVHGVFSVQPTVGSPGTAADFSAEDEVRWGKNVADAASRAGVGHFLFTSISGADRPTRLRPANLDSKWAIEQHVRSLRLPATILRPVSFMENYTGGYYLHGGGLTTALEPHVPQQIIAVDDVGVFAALVLADPQQYVGQALEIAGDELTPVQIAAAIKKATGRSVPYLQLPLEVLRGLSPAAAIANEWLNERGYQADIPAVRALHPGLLDFDTWLAKDGAAKISEYLAAQPTEDQESGA